MVWSSRSIKRDALWSPSPSASAWVLSRMRSWRRLSKPDGVLLKRVAERPSMVKADGLWVHQGSAEPGANWERIVDDVRAERIESVLKA